MVNQAEPIHGDEVIQSTESLHDHEGRIHMRLKHLAISAGCVIIVSGCAAKDLYNAAQQNRLQECAKLYGAQREECEARYQKDHETYQREKEAYKREREAYKPEQEAVIKDAAEK
jgi:hypothetical protein